MTSASVIAELQAHLRPCRNQVLMTAPLKGAGSNLVGGSSVDAGAREVHRHPKYHGKLPVADVTLRLPSQFFCLVLQ